MKSYKTEGIAFRSVKLKEADNIVTFLTPQGKATAVAKGVRKVGSGFGGRLEPCNDLDLVLIKGRTLDTVTQVQVKKSRPWLRTDYAKLTTAFAVLEMAEKLATDRGPERKLFKLVQAVLDRLETEKRLSLLLLTFDTKAVAIAGFFPNLSSCVVCGGSKDLTKVSVGDGGVVCAGCGAGRKTIYIDVKAKKLIARLLNLKMHELQSVPDDTKTTDLVRKVLWSHIRYHVHGDFKTRSLEGLAGPE